MIYILDMVVTEMLFMIELTINIVYFYLALFIPGKIRITNIEITRKISHILCGNWIFVFAFFNQYYATNIIIMIFMIILMSLSYKYHIFKGVERIGQVKSYGTVYFFVALLIFVIFSKLYNLNRIIYINYFLPLIYGDAFAAIVGKKINWFKYKIFGNTKTVSGNIGMLFISFISLVLYNFVALNGCYTLLYLFWVSIIATVIEAISVKGTDNFTIPMFTMYICEVLL